MRLSHSFYFLALPLSLWNISSQSRGQKKKKAGLKCSIQTTKVMSSGPVTSWQIEGEKVETVTDFIFLGCKITMTVTAVMKLKDAYSLEGKL